MANNWHHTTEAKKRIGLASRGNKYARKSVYDSSLYRSRIYRIWSNMLTRCYNKNSSSYKLYGARNITVCSDWDNFSGFYKDMSVGYSENLSLDRIDNSKGYSKENCRWATRKEQANNTRRNRVISYNGTTRNLSEWASILGIKRTTITQRIDAYGWSVEKCFKTI